MNNDAYNYRPLFRHSYTFRGTVAKKYGGISYMISVETFAVIAISLIVDLFFVSFFIGFKSPYAFAAVVFPVYGIYKVYDLIKPDGLKAPQFVWQYLKYFVKFYLLNQTLSHDIPVYYTENEVKIQ
ncbi:hypothetical protein D3P96_03670 [Weissella viridescens]|uniref:TcpE family n=1 Tax=Weissella viridescens TaxID=1629 RepID=A0A3P2RCT6_WEIVI|nr:hypothetical protein [Weissella viridescens]RRG18394.1 hypothetical protein D3P96_03670 [Weissella viridescens]